MNLKKIQSLAISGDDFSSYEGDPGVMYTGYNDDMVDFGGDGNNSHFGAEIISQRRFTVTLVNTFTSVKQALLSPSYSPSLPAGNAGGAPIADGAIVTVGADTLTASGSPKTIAELLKFIERNPARLIGMKITSNATDQLAQQVVVQRKSPFATLQDEFIDLASYTREEANNDKMVTVRGLNYQFDDQTEIRFPVAAGAAGTPTRTTITLYFGAVLNPASALNKKSAKAGNNPAVAQVRAAVASAQ
jgi:hypothetical protein